MRDTRKSRPRRLLCLALAFVLALALLPYSALAEEGAWGEAFHDHEQAEQEAISQTLLHAQNQLPTSLGFSLTAYAPPEGVSLVPGEGDFDPATLPAGALTVTVTTEGTGGGEDNAVATSTVTLPQGVYTLAFSDPTDGGSITNMTGLTDENTLTLAETATLSYTITSQAPALTPDLNDYVTELTLSVNGGTPIPVGELTSLNVGDTIEVAGTFAISNPYALGFQVNKPYSVDLPQGLHYSNPASTAEDGVTFELTPAHETGPATATLTFTMENLENYADIVGSFSYRGTVGSGAGEGGETLHFTIAGQVVTIPITVPTPTAKVTKTGTLAADAEGALVRWTVTVTSPAGTFPAGLVISDEMTSGGKAFHELQTLESVHMDGQPLTEADYTLTPNHAAGTFALTLNQDTPGKTMTLVFTSNLSRAGLTTLFGTNLEQAGSSYTRTVDNKVTVTEGSEGAFWGEANASVQNTKVKLLTKVFVNEGQDGANGLCQTWRIFVNQSFMTLEGGTVITEHLPDNLDFVSATAYRYQGLTDTGYYPPTSNPNSYTKDAALIAVNSNNPRKPTFTLQEPLREPMVIEVKTKRNGTSSQQSLNNKVTMPVDSYTLSAEAQSGVRAGTYLYKTAGDPGRYNLSKGTAAWKLYFGKTDGAVTITDTMETKNGMFTQALIPTSVVISQTDCADLSQITETTPAIVATIKVPDLADGREKTVTVDGLSFTVQYNQETRQLTVKTDKAVPDVYLITFDVTVANEVLFGTLSAYPGNGPFVSRLIANAATLKIEGDAKEYSASANQNNGARNFDKIMSNPAYNAADRTITWLLKANCSALSYQADSFQIIDRLPKGLEFVTDENGTVDPASITLMSGDQPLADLGYSGTYAHTHYDDKDQLTISIVPTDPDNNEPFNLPVQAHITTRITDAGMKLIFDMGQSGHGFRNYGYQAGLDFDGVKRWDSDWEEKKITGIPIEKSAAYDKKDASIDWSVAINPGHLPIVSTTERMVVVDTLTISNLPSSIQPSDLVDLDSTSLILTRTPKDGTPDTVTLVPVNPAANIPATGSYYSYDTQTQIMTFHIDTTEGNADDAYTLSYTTLLNVPKDYEQSDTISIKNGVSWWGQSSTGSVTNIRLSEVKIALSTMLYSKLAVTKVDAAGNGRTLAGATFALYRMDNGVQTEPPVGTVVTGADGKATFSRLASGAYQLMETKAPDGYALDPTPIDVTIKNTKEGETVQVTKENTRIYGGIQITKVDAKDSTPLGGAQFTLFEADGTTPYPDPAPAEPRHYQRRGPCHLWQPARWRVYRAGDQGPRWLFAGGHSLGAARNHHPAERNLPVHLPKRAHSGQDHSDQNERKG